MWGFTGDSEPTDVSLPERYQTLGLCSARGAGQEERLQVDNSAHWSLSEYGIEEDRIWEEVESVWEEEMAHRGERQAESWMRSLIQVGIDEERWMEG